MSSRQHNWPAWNSLDYPGPLWAAGSPGICLDQQHPHCTTGTTPEHEAICWAPRNLSGTPVITLEHHGSPWTANDHSGLHGAFLSTRDHDWPPGTSVDYQGPVWNITNLPGPLWTTVNAPEHQTKCWANRNLPETPGTTPGHQGPTWIIRYLGPFWTAGMRFYRFLSSRNYAGPQGSSLDNRRLLLSISNQTRLPETTLDQQGPTCATGDLSGPP